MSRQDDLIDQEQSYTLSDAQQRDRDGFSDEMVPNQVMIYGTVVMGDGPFGSEGETVGIIEDDVLLCYCHRDNAKRIIAAMVRGKR